MIEEKFVRTVKQFGNMGKIIIASENLLQFVDEYVEITVRRQDNE